MPIQSEINQRLSADNSEYRSVMNQSERIADKTGKGILKKLDLRDATRTFAVALGLSIDVIAEKLARLSFDTYYGQTQEALDKIVEANGAAADKQIAQLEKVKKAHQDLADERKKIADDEEKLWLDFYKSELQRTNRLHDEKIKAAFEEDLEWVKAEDKKEKIRLDGIKAAHDAELAASAEVAKAEEARIAEKFKSLVDQWTGFEVLIGSKGRGDTQLSDRELERKIANIQSELSASAGQSLGRFQGSAGTGSSDFLTQQQVGAANQAQAELDFRRQVRQSASVNGEDAAFRQFGGLTEQRFREILQAASSNSDVVAELKRTNAILTGQTLRVAPVSAPNPTFN